MTTISEQLLYTTVRLEGNKKDGVYVGTGFFYMEDNKLYLVTNKHVVKGVSKGHFQMHKARMNGDKKELFSKDFINVEFSEKNFISHPDPDVDVAVTNVSDIINTVEGSGHLVYWKAITKQNQPSKDIIDKFITPIEEVVFVGYPSGIWDSVNLLPVVRKGITATAYYKDFMGKKTFLVDASVFPGSSGSPVFIYYSGSYSDKQGNLFAGSRLYFLGIIAETWYRVEEGELKIKDIPTETKIISKTHQMIDLGIVFKAETVDETISNYINEVNQ